MITRIEGQWIRNEDALDRERRPRRKPERLKKRDTQKQGQDYHMPLKRDAHCVLDVMA
jgi:hypothetical protein